MSRIEFEDPRGLADLGTFLGRARQVAPDGAVRLQVMRGLLVATVAVLEGSGLLGEGTVLSLRVVPVASGDDSGDHSGESSGDDSRVSELDATVSIASVIDRLARGDGGTSLPVPPATVQAPWVGLSAPRGGWEPVGTLSSGAVDRIAREGIAAVAEGTPEGAGAHAVEALRHRVWGAMSETAPPVPSGLALGAHVLGFTDRAHPDAAVTVSMHGRWTRLSTSRGHVLGR